MHHGKLRITIIHRWVEMKVRRLIILELFLAWLTANPYPLKNKHLPRVAELLPKWHRGPQHEHHGHHAKPLQLEGHSHLKWVGRKNGAYPQRNNVIWKMMIKQWDLFRAHHFQTNPNPEICIYLHVNYTVHHCVNNSSYMPKSYHP